MEKNALTTYKNRDYLIVEGVVTDFHPMPYEGHQDECFSVETRRFCYSDFEITPGFHNTSSHNGPIRSGLPVRIAYSGGTILRLDIPKDQVPKFAQSKVTKENARKEWEGTAQNDPLQQQMTIAFAFTMVCWTLWWNIQWKRVMRFWLRPPYRLWTERFFRVFFALNSLGAIIELAQQLHSHPQHGHSVVRTVKVTATMCAVVAIMSAVTLWTAERRDRKAQGMLTTLS